MREIRVPARIGELDRVLAFVDGELEPFSCPPKVQMTIDIAVEEVFANIANYAYEGEDGYAVIGVAVKQDPSSDVRQAVIRFCDWGRPYNPLAKKDPDLTLSVDEREIGGLGIYMVRQTMDDVAYAYEEGKNILTLRKTI